MAWLESDFARYLTNKSGAADFVGDWILCKIGRVLLIQVDWIADAGTAGTLSLEGTMNPTVGLNNAAAIGAGLVVPTTTGIFGPWPTIGATADKAAVVVEVPFTWMRLVVQVAGGTANQFQGWRELRGG